MADIKFSTLKHVTTADLKRIARIHQEQPLEWIEGYAVREEAVEGTYKELITPLEDKKSNLIAAYNDHGDLVGFHWISVKNQGEQTFARIHSLWVDPKYRRRGIAHQLKELGEAWMRAQGAVRVTTEVFYVNQKMIDLNIKLGFTPWQVEMIKEL